MQDYFYAVSTTASDPEKVWATNAAFGYDINSAMITERDGTVFYGTKNGLLFALNGKTGAIEWEHKAGVGIMNTVVPLTGTEVLTTDFDGNITLISEQR
jgi:outer membrane protein assembly factor BamB